MCFMVALLNFLKKKTGNTGKLTKSDKNYIKSIIANIKLSLNRL